MTSAIDINEKDYVESMSKIENAKRNGAKTIGLYISNTTALYLSTRANVHAIAYIDRPNGARETLCTWESHDKFDMLRKCWFNENGFE